MGGALIQQEVDGGVRILRLARGRGNALDEATLRELAAVFADSAEARATVLTGSGPSFCTGLDLLENYERERGAMARTMEAFHEALSNCFLYPAPVVAALGGHALAGGALLALACDRRLMGGGRFGIHGVHLGVSYPQVAVEILRHQLGRSLLEDLLYAGHIHDPEEAGAAGLIDRVVRPEILEACAIEEARQLVRGGPELFALTKQSLRNAARKRLRPMCPSRAERWLDQWFHPETRHRVGRARDALAGAGGAKPGA